MRAAGRGISPGLEPQHKARKILVPRSYHLKLSPITSVIFTLFLMGSVFKEARAGGTGDIIVTDDFIGKLGTASTNGFNGGSANAFFTPLGTNNRTCETCHISDDAYTISPATAKNVARKNFRDPLFDPVDGGADCPPVSYFLPDARNASLMLQYALIREQIPIPSNAEFSIDSARNPKNCQIWPLSPDWDKISGKLVVFRRPLPTTNLLFLSDVRWDARETRQPIITGQNFTNTGPLDFDLGSQANGASVTHELSSPITGTQAQTDIVAFERNLFTAQLSLKTLKDLSDRGGPGYLAKKIAPNFFFGQNDPLGKNFSPNVFTLFADWEPQRHGKGHDNRTDLQKAIGEGERIFNNRTFTIANVQGLNSAKGDPLYNPTDPLAGKPIVGTCSTCHNTPNVGNHSSSLPLNIGVANAILVDNDGLPLRPILDTANLPVYTLKSSSGSMVRVTDPVRALITGRWEDVGKVKVPVLRGLAGRPPYFHNGSAQDLATVVSFYNARFSIGLTPEESNALMLFLLAL
jgi:cytochrome c peroxidase